MNINRNTNIFRLHTYTHIRCEMQSTDMWYTGLFPAVFARGSFSQHSAASLCLNLPEQVHSCTAAVVRLTSCSHVLRTQDAMQVKYIPAVTVCNRTQRSASPRDEIPYKTGYSTGVLSHREGGEGRKMFMKPVWL